MRKEGFNFYNETSLKSYNLDETMRYQLGMLDSLDAVTRVHSENVANLTCRLCEYLHMNTIFTIYCTICAYLHDIGKLFIPPKILQKNGPLTPEEYEVIKTHTSIGYKMCIENPKLKPYAAGPKYHHEALNGTGYPEGLDKKNIPIEGQIIRVADEFDAIVNKRQYKSHIGISDALKILVEETKPFVPENTDIKINDKVGKINPRILKALFKVVIDDINYEISCIFEYVKYLELQIKRLEDIEEYIIKKEKTKRESQKEYLEACIKSMFEKGENFENYKNVLEEYKIAYLKRKEIINHLFNEIKIIKKLRV